MITITKAMAASANSHVEWRDNKLALNFQKNPSYYYLAQGVVQN